ncbi:META domain-containing protein [Helicobacter cetorum]|uniref:Putative secreted motility protein n=1 Tax=Helicobacter cetorum (strain ATCC BAA-540 / CCUG 52418 / MIT 99-5656) TaxID=1163745 RepID=I0ESS4_HELCM|nr:META domain-containing protein [Helicobacter cetorum]AFI05993.1 putative secreted motility protein [Helicobacter cetorum MIT 99-5656]
MNLRLMVMSVAGAFVFSGCFFLKWFDKKISSNNWHIQKVEMGNRTYDIDTMLADSAFRENEEEQDSLVNTALPKDKAISDAKELERKEKRRHWYELFKKKSKPKNAMGEFVFDQKENRIYGKGYCNRYFASYSWYGTHHIEIEDSGISRKVCKDEVLMAFELKFMENFKGSFIVTKDKNTLILDNEKMKIYLVTP